MVGLPVAFVANIIVARALGPVQFGHLATLMLAYVIAAMVANAGVSDATIQWGAGAFSRGATSEILDLVRRCAGYHLLVEVPLIVAVTAVLLHDASWEVQLVACLGAGVTMWVGTAAVVQTFLSRTATAARVALAANVALQVAVVSAAVSSHSGPVTWAVRVAVASSGPIILLVLLPRRLRSAVLRPLLPRGWPAGFLSYALKAAVGGLVATLVFSRSELFVLQAHHLVQAAGVYALGFGLAAQITAPIDAVLGPMMPAAASLAASAPERLPEAVLRGFRFTAFAAGGLAALAIPTLSALIPTIYGRGFTEVAQLILPLGLISCIQSLNHPVTAFLYGTRRVGATLIINAVAFSLDIAIAIATVEALHAWGATIANATGQLISLGAAAVLLLRKVSLPMPALFKATRSFAEGTVAATCGWLVATELHLGWMHAGGRAVAGFAVGLIIFATSQHMGHPRLTRQDVDILSAAIPRPLRRRAIGALAIFGVTP
jgi:O-antigen/teichoic acid export membrane protein